MLIKKRALVPGPFSRSLFKTSDQTKEYLIKQNNQWFSQGGLELVIVFKQLIKMAKLHIMVVNSILLARVRVRFQQLTISKTSKCCSIPMVLCVMVEQNIHNIPSWNIKGKFCWDDFFVLDKERTFSQK